MAGIVGLCCAEGMPPVGPELEAMLDAAAYRGPDGRETWRSGPVALGHLRLWTTPESRYERLPLADPRAGLAITADARIDNRAELITALGLHDEAPHRPSDGELILAAYARWGDDCASHLLGDFAFCIWDAGRRRLFCARDHFGVRPLYYSDGEGVLAVASDVRALLALPWVSREVDEHFVAGYLALHFEEARTAYRGVLRLPPAHTLTRVAGRSSLRRYWTLNPSYELRLRSDDEYAEALRSVLSEAVQCRLRSAYPVGSTLSGGLDSSSISCLAQRSLEQEGSGRRLSTFSGTYERFPQSDELPYIRAVITKTGAHAHLVPVDGLGPFQAYRQSVAPEEGPYLGMSFYLHWGLYRAAQEQGVRVMLDGHGGDDVVSHGYAWLNHLARRGHWRALLREVRALLPEGKSPLPMLKGVAASASPGWVRAVWRRLHGVTAACRLLAGSPVSPELARRVRLLAALEGADRASRAGRSFRGDHCAALAAPAYSLTFEAAGKLGSRFSLEPRYPFFDRRVVELCVALPPQQKLRQGWTRYVLRRGMHGLLPEAVAQRRDKADLSPAFFDGLLHADSGQLAAVIEEAREALTAFVDMGAVAEAQARCLSGEGVRAHYLPVWLTATLAAWLLSGAAGSP